MGLGPENGRFRQDIPPLPPRENLYGVVPPDVEKSAHSSLRDSMIKFKQGKSAALEYNSSLKFFPLHVDSRLGGFFDRTIEHWGKEDKRKESKDINGSSINGINLVHRLKFKSDGMEEKELPITLGFVPVESNRGTIDIFIPLDFPPLSQMTSEMAAATIIKAIDLEILNAKAPPKISKTADIAAKEEVSVLV